MNETEPTLTTIETDDLEARGAATIVTNDLENAGRLVNPFESTQILNPVEALVNDDQTRFDALELAKQGKLDGITDPTEKATLTARFEEEGQKGLESLVESLQRKVTQGQLDAQGLAVHIAEAQLGTDARETPRMEEAINVARQSIENTLATGVPQALETATEAPAVPPTDASLAA